MSSPQGEPYVETASPRGEVARLRDGEGACQFLDETRYYGESYNFVVGDGAIDIPKIYILKNFLYFPYFSAIMALNNQWLSEKSLFG